MGYYASGSGDILLKKDAPVEKIMEGLGDAFSEVCRTDSWRGPCEDGIEIEVSNGDRFRCDEAEEALRNIDPFTIRGEIYMTGEDDSVWRYRFADGRWTEEQGHVLYEEDRRESCFIPIYTVSNAGVAVMSFASRDAADRFCSMEADKFGPDTRLTVTETALKI